MRRRRGESGAAIGGERLAAARPDVDAEIVEAVVPIGEQREHGAILVAIGRVQRARGGVEIIPCRGHRDSRSREQILAIDQARSEEHTSELQSLMRISYAVFCLKKKNK